MSRKPIARSPDLLRLQNEGYDLEIRGGCLLIKDVPYVNSGCRVLRGTLIVKLDLAGDIANKPADHVAYWAGEYPCHNNGSKIIAFENNSPPPAFGDGVKADFLFSAKADYRDYYHKVTTYIGRISAEAAVIDTTAVPQTHPVIPADSDEDVFKYVDTASSRAGIGALNARVAGQKIGIVGVGGTGAYLLDLIAKTPVAEIHLFDGDVFSSHNAFRAPGAPTIEQLRAKPQKANYFSEIYTNMRRGIVVHDLFLDRATVAMVGGLDFVFLCLDTGEMKRAVVDRLVENGTPFIEVGMGLVLAEDTVGGIIRVSTSTPSSRSEAAPHISYAADNGAANEYGSNIQIAELNALNAAMAVIRWKKFFGIYRDARDEYYGGYSIASGEIIVKGKK
jgi:hypothetical protein